MSIHTCTSSYTLKFLLCYNNNGKSSNVNQKLVSSSKTTMLYLTFGKFLCHQPAQGIFLYITEPVCITVTFKSWIPVKLCGNALLTAYQFQIQLHQLSFKHIKVLEQVSHKDISTEKFFLFILTTKTREWVCSSNYGAWVFNAIQITYKIQHHN